MRIVINGVRRKRSIVPGTRLITKQYYCLPPGLVSETYSELSTGMTRGDTRDVPRLPTGVHDTRDCTFGRDICLWRLREYSRSCTVQTMYLSSPLRVRRNSIAARATNGRLTARDVRLI